MNTLPPRKIFSAGWTVKQQTADRDETYKTPVRSHSRDGEEENPHPSIFGNVLHQAMSPRPGFLKLRLGLPDQNIIINATTDKKRVERVWLNAIHHVCVSCKASTKSKKRKPHSRHREVPQEGRCVSSTFQQAHDSLIETAPNDNAAVIASTH